MHTNQTLNLYKISLSFKLKKKKAKNTVSAKSWNSWHDQTSVQNNGTDSKQINLLCQQSSHSKHRKVFFFPSAKTTRDNDNQNFNGIMKKIKTWLQLRRSFWFLITRFIRKKNLDKRCCKIIEINGNKSKDSSNYKIL